MNALQTKVAEVLNDLAFARENGFCMKDSTFDIAIKCVETCAKIFQLDDDYNDYKIDSDTRTVQTADLKRELRKQMTETYHK